MTFLDLAMGAFLCCGVSFAEPLRLTEFYLDVDRYVSDAGREPLLMGTDYKPKWKTSLNFKINMGPYVWWKNQVNSLVDQRQFRTIGWHFSFGIDFVSWLSVIYKHRSDHLLDTTGPFEFPVVDTIGIRIHLLKQ